MQGFNVRAAADGAELDRRLAEGPADLLVLDVNMPGEDGFTIARRLREGGSRAGILMLTAAGDVPSRVRGLDGGADDYLAKPVELRELLARVRSVLRRLEAEPAAPAAAPKPRGVRFGRCTLDLGARRLSDGTGAEVPLTAMEYDLLATFARHPRQVLSRERLAELAHSRPLAPGDRSVDIRVTRLRQKLEPDPASPAVIRTVRGEGYVYEPDG
jgi:DNA-binding response OmpR family regulator